MATSGSSGTVDGPVLSAMILLLFLDRVIDPGAYNSQLR